MDAEVFNPPRPILDIEGIDVELKPFSLYEKARAMNDFKTKENPNGIEVLSQKLRDLDKLSVAKFGWQLVKDRSLVTKEAFYKFCEDGDNMLQVYEALIIVLNNSEPNKHQAKKLAELKKF